MTRQGASGGTKAGGLRARPAIRALSVRRPWSWAMVYGSKRVDNRARGAAAWTYRGEMLLQTAKQWDAALRGCVTVHEAPAKAGYDWAELAVPPDDLRQSSLNQLARDLKCASRADLRGLDVSGAITGRGVLVDIHLDVGCCRPHGESFVLRRWTNGQPEYSGSCAHLVFEDVRPVWPPIECDGALGLWVPPPDVVEELEAA